MGRFKLSSPDCSNGLAAELGVPCLEWFFGDDSLGVVSRLPKRDLEGMLLDFRKVFPCCSDELVNVSARFNALYAALLGKRIVVTMVYDARSPADTHETAIVRAVCLGEFSGPPLVNDL